jgi:hypothetical protein
MSVNEIRTTGAPVRADSAPRDAGSEDAVASKLQAIEGMTYDGLRTEWRRLYRSHPPKRVARDLLVLGVAWKIQEQAYGGLGAATKRRLADLAKSMEQDGDLTRSRVTRLKPGAKLIREWRGKRWRSLSVIAREITGAHWSGPRFFGVNGKAEARVAIGEAANA